MTNGIPSEVNGTQVTSRMRTFANHKSVGLNQIQRHRFQGFDQESRANQYKALVKIYIQTGGAQAAAGILQELKDTIRNIDENDLPTLMNMWEKLASAEEGANFSQLLAETVGDKTPDAESDDIEETPQATSQTRLQRLMAKLSNIKINKKLLNPKQAFQEIFPTVSRMSAAGFSFFLWNAIRRGAHFGVDRLQMTQQTVPCVMMGIPVPHVQEIEIARSGKILKFRATGSVFLANQEGGLDAIRIEGYLFRSEIIWILAFWALFSYGGGDLKEIPELMNPEATSTLTLTNLRKMTDVTRYNRNRDKPSYEYHKTFPIVTRHIIMPNCYIETLSFEEKTVFGKDTIGFTILLRTYKEPKEFELYKRPHSPANYFAPAMTTMTRWGKVIEATINGIWRGMNASGIFIKEREWKLEGETDQGLDVTYDISAENVAITTLFGLAGVMGNTIPSIL